MGCGKKRKKGNKNAAVLTPSVLAKQALQSLRNKLIYQQNKSNRV